jgi:hypothetical protein
LVRKPICRLGGSGAVIKRRAKGVVPERGGARHIFAAHIRICARHILASAHYLRPAPVGSGRSRILPSSTTTNLPRKSACSLNAFLANSATRFGIGATRRSTTPEVAGSPWRKACRSAGARHLIWKCVKDGPVDEPLPLARGGGARWMGALGWMGARVIFRSATNGRGMRGTRVSPSPQRRSFQPAFSARLLGSRRWAG